MRWGEAGPVHRIDPASAEVEECACPEGFLILGVTLDGHGNLCGRNVGRAEVVKVSPDGSVTSFSRGVEGRDLVNPEYGVFDDEGNFYYSDSGSYFGKTGCLYVVRPDGRTG